MRLLAPFAFFAALALAQPSPSRGVNWYNLEKEAALGRRIAGDFRRQARVLEDERLRHYFESVIARISPYAQSPFPTSIEITADPAAAAEITAFPGGYLFVPLSVLLTAESEAGLAGSLAHSLAHVAARHGTRAATRGQIAGLSTIPLIFIGGWDGVRIPVGFQEFARHNEVDADRLAADWMAQAGYPPAAYAAWLERTQPKSLAPIPARIDALRAASSPAASSETGEFAAVRDYARSLAPPPPERKPPTLRRQP
jgi:beta-barrel assembly-enhancing protease